ncbi:hypothetical protein CEXT_661701 [Caerostris extrusa]|uniref:Uncharacterized protein n=1 Tax=Caerostris extrusa TaxID=172846 RepID=A0AAV4S5U2_CAEEX|nr:hypothetical protein CEXT_661701 [Caerostris extrusa]
MEALSVASQETTRPPIHSCYRRLPPILLDEEGIRVYDRKRHLVSNQGTKPLPNKVQTILEFTELKRKI